MSKILVMGAGIEFGWLVARFIPRARRYSTKFTETVVVCEKGMEYLFSDFSSKFEYVKMPGRSERWLYEAKEPKVPSKIKSRHKDAYCFIPNRKTCMAGNRDFLLYKPEIEKGAYWDIIIHARGESKYHSGNRNWPGKHWDDFVKNFPHLNIACIGSLTGSRHIPGTTDMRGIESRGLCNLIANAKVVVGPSSGPMHLASFCGTSHVVWTDSKTQKVIKGTNRKRYEKLWNPLGTPVAVIDKYGWRPPVKVVVETVKKILEEK